MELYRGLLSLVQKEAKNERNAYNALAKALNRMGGMFVFPVGERSVGLFL